MLLTEFDEKDYIEGVKEESERRGREEGRMEGRLRGAAAASLWRYRED